MSYYPKAVRFIESTTEQCKFFLPGQSGMDGLVCGETTDTERSYCDCHHRRIYQPGSTPRVFFIDASSQDAPGFTDHEPDLTEVLQ
ncbi:hypothetical protein [Bradyrhizobium sp. ORS 375]|uniref:hypothetical protein n=1 Tax=Bradyrhizobium sp. (strain ORS 375) TaxID=566679 RepID=UPI0002E34266|nr:hypothetical protein [Bradyrhizobium sp. ORS 375]